MKREKVKKIRRNSHKEWANLHKKRLSNLSLNKKANVWLPILKETWAERDCWIKIMISMMIMFAVWAAPLLIGTGSNL